MISAEMQKFLMANGLNRTQAESATANLIVNALMSEDGKALANEAAHQVKQMKEELAELRGYVNTTKQKLESSLSALAAITEAEKNYGTITDEKARTALALYASLVKVGIDSGASESSSVINAGYIVYAFLGGQARSIDYGDSGSTKKTANAVRF